LEALFWTPTRKLIRGIATQVGTGNIQITMKTRALFWTVAGLQNVHITRQIWYNSKNRKRVARMPHILKVMV
jgi:hypothetical protein